MQETIDAYVDPFFRVIDQVIKRLALQFARVITQQSLERGIRFNDFSRVRVDQKNSLGCLLDDGAMTFFTGRKRGIGFAPAHVRAVEQASGPPHQGDKENDVGYCLERVAEL